MRLQVAQGPPLRTDSWSIYSCSRNVCPQCPGLECTSLLTPDGNVFLVSQVIMTTERSRTHLRKEFGVDSDEF